MNTQPYPANLTPLPSSLRPHCPTKNRLVEWKPAVNRSFRDSNGRDLTLPSEFVDRIQHVLVNGFANSTLETYASGLLAFHVFCDARNIPEDQQAPCSSDLLGVWIATMAGTYAGTSVKNYVHGVRAWHIIHGVEWRINKAEFDTLVAGAERLQPDHSKQKKRQPFTTEYISEILKDLNLSNPLDAACAGCLTSGFYCGALLGELTIPTLTAFSYITLSNLRKGRDRNGFECSIIHIPRTKSSPIEGEDVYFSKQLGNTDPETLLENHLKVNNPGMSDHMFAYEHKAGKRTIKRPLTKPAFLARIHKAAKNRGLPTLQGHGICIGATLEYLL